MRRVNAIKAAGEWDAAQSLDRVILDADERITSELAVEIQQAGKLIDRLARPGKEP